MTELLGHHHNYLSFYQYNDHKPTHVHVPSSADVVDTDEGLSFATSRDITVSECLIKPVLSSRSQYILHSIFSVYIATNVT